MASALGTKKRGAFIVIEGLDRSGKSTQAVALVARLEASNVSVKLIKFPDRTTGIGRMIDAYLRSETEVDDRAIHLLFSANRWELASSIEDALNTGTTIICDRYAFSGLAFSFSKPSFSSPCSDSAASAPVPSWYTWLLAPDAFLPSPDLTLFLDLEPEHARLRGGYGEERYETEEKQRRVREVFARIAREVGGSESGSDSAGEKVGKYGHWITIDANQPLEAVEASIWQHVDHLLSRAKAETAGLGPIRRLWVPQPQS